MIDPANEALYNNRALVPDHMETIDWWAARSAEARAELSGSLGVSYGDSPRQYIDIFPATTANAPIMVYIHGGYWQGNDPSFSSFIAPRLNALGYCVAVAGYDLCPDVTVDEITAQMRQACAYMYRHAEDYGADPDRLYVSGHSAGGHLTAEMMATNWTAVGDSLPRDLVKGGMPISGLFDLTPLVNTTINDKVGFDERSARRNSPQFRNPVCTGPLMLVVGGNESQGFFDQAEDLAAAWSGKLKSIEQVTIAGTDHFTVVRQLADANSPLIQTAAKLIA